MKADLSIKQLIPADPRDYLLISTSDIIIPIVVFHVFYECKDEDGNTVQKINTVGTDYVNGPVRQNIYSDWIDINSDFGERGGYYMRAVSPIYPVDIREAAQFAVEEEEKDQSDFEEWKNNTLRALKSRSEHVVSPGIIHAVENAKSFNDLINI